MTIREIIKRTYSQYKLSPLDSGILLSLAGNLSKEYIIAHPEKIITKLQEKKYKKFIKRRAAGEPIAYIAGTKEFFGLDFFVNKNVLIPRPETELIVEEVIKKIQNDKFQIPDTLIDVGTGSGNIIISVYKNLPQRIRRQINFYATDISNSALRIAKQNAKKQKIDKKIKFSQSDLLKYFLENKKIKPKNIFVVANLPYVSLSIYKKNINILQHEPTQSLISKQNGLRHYVRLIKQIRKLNGLYYMLQATCFIEISPEQKPEIARFSKIYLPGSNIKFFKDFSGKWRVAEIRI
jgi:release factor glutamine methyltransferase